MYLTLNITWAFQRIICNLFILLTLSTSVLLFKNLQCSLCFFLRIYTAFFDKPHKVFYTKYDQNLTEDFSCILHAVTIKKSPKVKELEKPAKRSNL